VMGFWVQRCDGSWRLCSQLAISLRAWIVGGGENGKWRGLRGPLLVSFPAGLAPLGSLLGPWRSCHSAYTITPPYQEVLWTASPSRRGKEWRDLTDRINQESPWSGSLRQGKGQGKPEHWKRSAQQRALPQLEAHSGPGLAALYIKICMSCVKNQNMSAFILNKLFSNLFSRFYHPSIWC
jgi:hypothetical protein